MEISFDDYPVDIILCMVWSTILLPVALLNVEGIIRVILGLPFILFIPGYVLIYALFPSKKTDKGIDVIERIALSFGLSIAVVPLIGLGLNYTPWGIRLEPILISIFIFVIGVGLIAFYRWKKTDADERFTVSFRFSLPSSENRVDKALTFILAIAIIIAIASVVYVIAVPKAGERFTEFYLLNTDRQADNYPTNLTVGEEASVIIGVVNHEYRTITYTIGIWLINQTTILNESTQENEAIYTHAWFMDMLTVTLNHTAIDIDTQWKPQWEYNYTFSIDKPGEQVKLAFLLFTSPTDTYSSTVNYKDSITELLSDAYRETHLFITIT